MEPVIFGLVAAAGLGGFAAARVAAANRERAWRHAAEVARLTGVRVEKSAGFISRLSGEAGPLAVRLERYRRGKYEAGTRVVIRGLQHAPDELAFRREGMGSALGKALGNGEVELGDPSFDRVVYLQGSRELACALFDEDTRLRVVRMLEGSYDSPTRQKSGMGDGSRASMADGELRIELPGRLGQSDADRCPVVLLSALTTAARLVRPPDIVERLAENLGREPVEAVRLANLLVLLEEHHKHPKARAALERATRRDGSEEVRLRAALALGTRGWDALLEIASSETSNDQRAARAIAGLGDHLTGEQAKSILTHALLTRRVATAQACLESLGRRGGPEVIDLLRRVLTVEQDVLAAAAARALGETRSPEAEGLLLGALTSHPPEVLAAVAEALGRMGTVAAVMPLRSASERMGDRAFRRAARQAIAEIQARQQGAAPGQLSLAAGEAGQVSLLEDGTQGRLSITDEGEGD